jgi:hypothetical protein
MMSQYEMIPLNKASRPNVSIAPRSEGALPFQVTGATLANTEAYQFTNARAQIGLSEKMVNRW